MFVLRSLVLVDGNIKSEAYIILLDNNMLPTQWKQFGIGPFLYQLDRAPVHKAKVIALEFEYNMMNVKKDLPQSPDLKPIDHLWNELER